jgi:hypothetical protein
MVIAISATSTVPASSDATLTWSVLKFHPSWTSKNPAP